MSSRRKELANMSVDERYDAFCQYLFMAGGAIMAGNASTTSKIRALYKEATDDYMINDLTFFCNMIERYLGIPFDRVLEMVM